MDKIKNFINSTKNVNVLKAGRRVISLLPAEQRWTYEVRALDYLMYNRLNEIRHNVNV